MADQPIGARSLAGQAGGSHVVLGPGWLLWPHCALRAAGMPFDWLEPFATPPGASPEQARARSAEAVRRMLRQEPFLAALTWQNPVMVDNWVGRYADAAAQHPDPPLRRRDQREAKLASYAQRYCAKNDTIGFFGPVGWAVIDPLTGQTSVRDRGCLAGSSVYLEVWAAERLAARWAADPRLRPHLPVRLHPACCLRGLELRRPLRPALPLSQAQAALLATVRPGSTVADLLAVARALLGPDADPDGEVSRLEAAGALRVGFAVPLDEHPERSLAAQLRGIADVALRAKLEAELDRLTAARDELAGVAQASRPLRAAMRRMSDVFEELTQSPAGRAGQYGRVPAYLDSAGRFGATVGADDLAGLREPLTLLLGSARWFAGQVAQELRGLLAAELAKLSARDPRREATLADLQFACGHLLSGAAGTVVPAIAKDFRLRWAEIIGGTGIREVQLSTARITPLVTALFPESEPPDRPGWASARYHSPDLMLGFLDGRDAPLVWVLGELHMALNTLENRVFHTQGGARVLHEAATRDLGDGRILPLYQSIDPNVTSRTYPPSALHLDGAFTYWSPGDDAGHPSGVAGLPAASLAVRADDGEVVVCPDGQDWAATALEFLGEFVTAAIVNQFRLREPARHAPRVRIDSLVVCRESWRLPAADLVAAHGAGDYACVGLRSLLAGMGVARHAFYLTPAEPKPSYIDLDAPLHLHNLDAAARRVLRELPAAAHVDITEMLPAPGELWLADGSGQRYTAELRMVAVDDRPGAPARRQVLR